jgi:hypothetical protein
MVYLIIIALVVVSVFAIGRARDHYLSGRDDTDVR